MKKLIFFISSLLFLAPCLAQTSTKICDNQSFEWVFAAEHNSEIIFQTSYHHIDTSWNKLDTIIGNHVKLDAKMYTYYNLVSVDGDTNVTHENLAFDVVENPDASISISGNILNISMNPYCKQLEVVDRDDEVLYDMSWDTPPANMYLNLPHGIYYLEFTDNSSANCKKMIPIKIN